MISTIICVAATVAAIYLGIGAIAAGYESSQTDDPFDWGLMLKWPTRIF
jgi:hypothetical protein